MKEEQKHRKENNEKQCDRVYEIWHAYALDTRNETACICIRRVFTREILAAKLLGADKYTKWDSDAISRQYRNLSRRFLRCSHRRCLRSTRDATTHRKRRRRQMTRRQTCRRCEHVQTSI